MLMHYDILLLALDIPCFLNNTVYSFQESQKCVKVGTPEECQLLCQQTYNCSKFSYFTRNFDRSNDARNNNTREALDCCLVIHKRLPNPTVSIKQNVISGPQVCPIPKIDSPSGKVIFFKDETTDFVVDIYFFLVSSSKKRFQECPFL